MNGPALALSGSNLTGDVPFSVALLHAGTLHEAAAPPGTRGDLAMLADEVCRRAGLGPQAISRWYVDVGPGSYTGLRVACTFVRFLQRFGGGEVFAVDSLALLAARARPAAGEVPRRVHAALDARRDKLHVQPFTVGHDAVAALAPAAALPFERAIAGVRAGDVLVVPAATPAPLRERLRDAARAAAAGWQQEARITATSLLREPLPFVAAQAADLEPRYLMASYAEE